MKMEVVASGGRKKDFWDLHAFIDHFTVDDLLLLHKKCYPYQLDRESLLQQLNNFESAETVQINYPTKKEAAFPDSPHYKNKLQS